MPKTQNRAVMNWIFTFASVAAFLVVFGGLVRLTRSGLSIVEWNPVYGAVPPLNQQAWQTEFAKYQLTPEYIKVNSGMTLDQYKIIFLLEWFHRLVARLAGLIFAIPFFVFYFKKTIPAKEAGLYVVMGFLFIAQAIMGWIMVASGLDERPAVSHYALTAHLFLALTLIGLSLWTAFGHRFGFPDNQAKWSSASKLVTAGLVVLLIQIAYGGFTAGLKAGRVSDTWPLMLGQLIPNGLLSQTQPPLLNLVSAPLTVMFIHRWFAFVGLIVAIWIYWLIRKQNFQVEIMKGINLVLILVVAQIALGIMVVIYRVDITLALLHQANALALFSATIYVLHRLRAADAKA
ncbi:MAG: COX15/CtaA family protein [Chloroflexi bacterium]|nr:COX15/CtaA family protein [Chloroflexota bacterium]MBI3339344.1 COX15/CtaA family protein [Chloroflexota bacterium]